MLRGQQYTKPQTKSFFGTVAVACLSFVGSQFSPIIGYWLALLTMLMLIIAMHTNSFWPTQATKERILVFSLFWGLILGTLLPFMITVYITDGLRGIYEIFTSEP